MGLFKIFNETLNAAGVFANEGKMVDASFVKVPRQRGFVENTMNGSFIRTIGIARAEAKIGMMNLTYNICRCTQLKIVVAMG